MIEGNQTKHSSHFFVFHRDRALSRQFSELRDENRRLLSERQRLRSVLEDREEDVKALREEIARSRSR